MPWASRGGRATRLVIVIALATVALSGLVRLANLAVYPGLIYDEHFYVHDANSVLHGRVGPLQPLPWRPGDEIGLDHPPLGTLAIATGVAVMGNDPWGWRVPSAIAGTLLIALVYPLARRLCLPPRWALTALVLAAADPLLIVESRIGVLDPFVALWSAVCIYCALRFVQSGRPARWIILTGLAGGLAVASKWSGALALVAAAAIMGADYLRKHRTARSSDGMGQVDDGDVAGEGLHVAERAERPAGVATRLAGVVACLILLPLL
ncbi:MAG TPA: glycosyltransferase family 39 protein, partial [Thermoleophilia bacterium]|nr:glycosyltransferase family 39 protein [Thermoleophilia bacterium]